MREGGEKGEREKGGEEERGEGNRKKECILKLIPSIALARILPL